MADNTVQPPDLVSAGIVSPRQDIGSLIGLLRSQGSLPSQAFAMLQGGGQVVPGAVQGPQGGFQGMPGGVQESPLGLLGLLGGEPPPSGGSGQGQTALQAALSALAGGVSAAQGTKNPVQEQQRFQAQQQAQQAQLLQRAQVLKQRQQEKQQETFLTIADTLSKSDNENAREFAATIQLRALKDLGITPPVELAKALARRTTSQKEITDILTEFTLGFSRDTVAANHPGVSPSLVSDIERNRNNEDVRRILKLPTQAEERKTALDIRLKEAQAVEAERPELRADPQTTLRASILSQRLFGKSVTEISPQDRASVLNQAILQQRKDALDDFERKERIKSAFDKASGLPIAQMTDIFVDSAGNQPPADLLMLPASEIVKRGFRAISKDELKEINSVMQVFQIVKNIKTTVDQMKDQGLFVTRSGLGALGQRLRIAAQTQVGDPQTSKRLLKNLDSQKSEVIILMRQLGDKARAIKAFQNIMDVLSPNAGAPAVESILGQLESEIRAFGVKSRTPDMFTQEPTVFTSLNVAPLSGQEETLSQQQLQALKAAGFGDAQIDAFKRRKGLR